MKRDIYKIKKQYFESVKKYEKLAENIVDALKMLLDEANVSYLAVNYRIKTFDSFLKKMERKNYSNPFEQIEDICGIRIICYYRSDIEKICDVITKDFVILESQDKEALLEDDQFGYRSHHFIVAIKKEWLAAPNYKGLGNLKAEVQVRTNLMHTWAEIEHKLEYKKDDDIPTKFKRKFSRISAKLEEADEQFEELRAEINHYRQEMLRHVMEEHLLALEDNQINMDTLQVFLDCYFPKVERNTRLVSPLVSSLKQLNLTISDLKQYYKQASSVLDLIEIEVLESFEGNYTWYQTSSAITILELCCKEYQERFGIRKGMEEIIEKYRIITDTIISTPKKGNAEPPKIT